MNNDDGLRYSAYALICLSLAMICFSVAALASALAHLMK